MLNFTFQSPKISCINTSFKLTKVSSCNSKLLHKISHTFTVIFLKYTALNTAKSFGISTTLNLLISTQCAAMEHYISIHLSLFTITQRTRMLQKATTACVTRTHGSRRYV
jgi:hypothetical protein